RHHLRADEDVDLAPRDARQHRFDLGAARDIAIEPGHARLGKLGRDGIRDLLGSEALAHDGVRAAAARTYIRDALLIAAVVTRESIAVPVIRHRHRAVLAA